MRPTIWSPSEHHINTSVLSDFMLVVKDRTGNDFKNYDDLWQWSVEDKEVFWDIVWDFCGVIGDKGARVLDNNNGRMFGAQFFPDAEINYAENLLKNRGDSDAMVFRDEKGTERNITRNHLYNEVSRWQQAMKSCGVVAGDRVAGYMPNMPETIVVALAAISLGAIWSSASPDFGVQGVIDRFGQIEPKLLVSVDGYYYNGKVIDVMGKVKDIVPHLKGLSKTIIVPFAGSGVEISSIPDTQSVADFIGEFSPLEIIFTRVSFNHPLFIMFSSGTTGAPKCIVHGHGGTLLQHMKEHRLQCNIKPDEKVFYFTTCGWMMWNWLFSALASDATLLLYDGSPFYPDGNVLWDYASEHDCSFFGTSAKYIEAMKVNDIYPKNTHDISKLRVLASTGSPLVPASFDYVYEHVKSDLHLVSISGGTDIVSCFLLGNPVSPVYRGEIQCAGLGMAVDVFDDDGNPSQSGSGEMVCKHPFPSMPVSFWNDVDGSRYRDAYFDRFDNVWCHGDWIERTSTGGYIIHGRSDATLNPGGVRIGTAELYGQVEKISSVKDCVAIGQEWEGDVRIVLFVTLIDGCVLDDDLVAKVKSQIKIGASPRHVPAKIIEVNDIPRTKSGKITEIAVRDVVMGRPIKNVEALANPEALELFKNIEELKS
ncbi:MAG: acetoacetate--CoA ligase [Alphaproteobacteria bacterium]